MWDHLEQPKPLCVQVCCNWAGLIRILCLWHILDWIRISTWWIWIGLNHVRRIHSILWWEPGLRLRDRILMYMHTYVLAASITHLCSFYSRGNEALKGLSMLRSLCRRVDEYILARLGLRWIAPIAPGARGATANRSCRWSGGWHHLHLQKLCPI